MKKILLFCLLIIGGCKEKEKEEAVKITDSPPYPVVTLGRCDTLEEDGFYDEALKGYQSYIAFSRKNDTLLADWLYAQRMVAYILAADQKKRMEALVAIQKAKTEMKSWRMPMTKAEHVTHCALLLRETRILLDIGKIQESRSVFEAAEAVFRAHLYETEFSLAWYLFPEMANMYVRLGDFESAEHLFQEGLAYEKQFEQENVASFVDYGSAYLSQGNYEKALGIFSMGLSQKFVNPFTQTMLLLNQSESLARLNRIKEAVTVNESAREWLKNKDNFPNELKYEKCQRGYWENRAIIAEKQKKWEAAISYYHQTLAPAITHDMQRREKAGFIAAEANACFQLGQFDLALGRYHDAYMQFYPSASKEDMFEMPAASDLLTDKILADVLEGKARCFAQLGQFKNALQLYELIPVVEAQLRATHTFESSSLFALKKSRKRFDDAVELAWKGWKNTGDHNFAAMAFRFTEMARGVLQNKGIRMNDAYATLSKPDQEQDKNYATRIASAETELAEIENNDESRATDIMQKIRDLKARQQSFRNELIRTNPVYAAGITNTKICAINEAKNLLRPDQILLDYYLIDTVALYVFIADQRGNVSWQRIEWYQNGELSRFLGFMSKRNDKDDIADFIPVAYQLYQTLLAPVFQHISTGEGLCEGREKITPGTSLVIIPDMELAGLPFEALVTDTVGLVKKWGTLPYFLHQFNVAYAYSASLLQLQQDITSKRVGAARMPFAGFAPSYSNRDMLLENAERDVYYGKKLFGGDTYTQNTATEAAYRKIAEEAQILLFSMHGYANYEEPMLSHLRFGDSDDGPFEKNNSLTAGEIQHIPCRADLVVMSACHTGDGPLEQGEGVYSMARAFTISGVPSTVMSLWFLPEVSSSCMVQDFLTGIHQKQPKDVALRTAKLAWIKEQQGSKSKPYFWACFVTAGDMSPLDIAGSRLNWWYWVIGLVCFTAAILYFRRK